jgi:hypothetical protein
MSEAERIASLFENAPKTVSMLALAVAAGAEISNNGRIRLYSFSDGKPHPSLRPWKKPPVRYRSHGA